MAEYRGHEFDGMDDATFLEAITPAMDSVLTAVFYRVLGQSSLPWNIKYIERFMQLSAGPTLSDVKTRYDGEIVPIVVNNLVHAYLWKGMDVSAGHGIKTNIHVWGLKDGGNTVFTRKYWWTAYVLRSQVEAKLNLRPNALRMREYLGL